MAVAEDKTSPQAAQRSSWHGIVLQTLKRNDIRLVPYVPDRVLTTLIKNLHADPFFTTFPTAREEEAGRHRLRRLDGRHARRGADADIAVSRRSPTCWRRSRSPIRSR